MGVSKIVREIEGKWVGGWGYEGEIWVMGMVWVVWQVRVFGVFLENEWEWVSLGCEVWWEWWLRGEVRVIYRESVDMKWCLNDVWFVKSLLLYLQETTGKLLELYPGYKLPYKCSYTVHYRYS